MTALFSSSATVVHDYKKKWKEKKKSEGCGNVLKKKKKKKKKTHAQFANFAHGLGDPKVLQARHQAQRTPLARFWPREKQREVSPVRNSRNYANWT